MVVSSKHISGRIELGNHGHGHSVMGGGGYLPIQ